jgi:hypothetical protein
MCLNKINELCKLESTRMAEQQQQNANDVSMALPTEQQDNNPGSYEELHRFVDKYNAIKDRNIILKEVSRSFPDLLRRGQSYGSERIKFSFSSIPIRN